MASLTRRQLLDLYRWMLLTRTVEERLERMVRQGLTVGNLYRSLGQEATAVGAAAALEEGDWLCPAIRDLGALFVRGVPPREMFVQYMARDGLTGGKDTNTHFTLPGAGLLGPVSPLGDQVCVMAGIALAFRLRGEDRVGMSFLGEGGSRTGASHEGINLAAVQRLPLVIVLEHNRWAFSTPSTREAAADSWCDTADAYGIPAREVDGNDVLEVYDAALEAVERARRGEGASMVVAETYRMLGHAQHDPQPYVDPAELEAWRARDPLERFAGYLQEYGFASGEGLDDLRGDVEAEVERAAREALERDRPRPEGARTGVYGGGTPDGGSAPVPWTRREVVGYRDLPGSVRGWWAEGGKRDDD